MYQKRSVANVLVRLVVLSCDWQRFRRRNYFIYLFLIWS